MRLGFAVTAVMAAWAICAESSSAPIDRQVLVERHNPDLHAADPLGSLSVGNGQFACTVDVTGLQTFPEYYSKGIQLGTQSQWAWDSSKNPDHFSIDDVLSPYDAHGRTVLYADGRGKQKNSDNPSRAAQANAWLRANPHRVQLGRLGLMIVGSDGKEAKIGDIKNIRQTLDLWSGRIESRFTFEGQTVRVETVCHPERDLITARIESPLIRSGRLAVTFSFVERGETSSVHASPHRYDMKRDLETSCYFAALSCDDKARLQQSKEGTYLAKSDGDVLEAALSFAPKSLTATELPTFETVKQASAADWRKFWLGGGCIDLSASKDARWRELERRIVLSQYLTAIQCCGSTPPQETGLVQNSWFGKFHLEMHWWHAAHFALWGRPELLARSLGWYRQVLPAARASAARNGYAGARWPKMVGPDGVDSPSPIGGFLIWQQPHPIYYAELIYRANPDRATLEKYRTLVAATAEFMASYPVWDASTKAFVLGPPLIPAQESYGKMRERVVNPTYELAYWYWGLQTAQRWRERLDLPREPHWDEVCRGLAKPLVREGRYEAIAVEPFTQTHDHPSLLQAYGFVPPTPSIDPATMNRTYDWVLKNWNMKATWGWDYPVMAMAAARLGRGNDAVDALLLDTPKNRFLVNGHNYQRSDLPLYLPGNGGLLAAVAMMAAGWDNGPRQPAPGFPADGSWSVRWEGLRPMP